MDVTPSTYSVVDFASTYVKLGEVVALYISNRYSYMKKNNKITRGFSKGDPLSLTLITLLLMRREMLYAN